MMNNTFFRYITGNSKIHLLNSKMKIIWFLLSLITTILIRDYISVLLIFLYYIVIASLSKIKFKTYLSNLFIPWPIYVLAVIITFIISFNANLSIIVGLDVMLIVFLFLILTSTTSLSEIAWGFDCLFSKLKKIGIPVSKISLRIAMHIKFVEVLHNKSKEIRKSMAYRGVSYGKGFKSFRKMIVPVITLSNKTSRRMVKIMKLRFYGNSKIRTNYHENKKTSFDKLLIFISVVLLYAIIYLGWC